ncbi:MAG: hypothetical protein WCO65_01005 [bacterium]
MEEQDTLKKGDTVHRPYRSSLTVNDMGAQGQYTRQDITDIAKQGFLRDAPLRGFNYLFLY